MIYCQCYVWYTLMPFLGCIAFFTLAGGLPMETSLLAIIGCIYILMFMNVHCPSWSNKQIDWLIDWLIDYIHKPAVWSEKALADNISERLLLPRINRTVGLADRADVTVNPNENFYSLTLLRTKWRLWRTEVRGQTRASQRTTSERHVGWNSFSPFTAPTLLHHM